MSARYPAPTPGAPSSHPTPQQLQRPQHLGQTQDSYGGGGFAAMSGGSGVGGIAPPGTQASADLSLMGDATGVLSNALDIDMSLPMDLDLDMSQVDGSAGFTPMGPSQQSSTMMAAPDLNRTGSGQSDAHTNSAPPPESSYMSGVGAGPLPTGFGMPAAQNAGALTEFTKRRNWSHRVIEELKDFLHILTPDGRILYASPSCKALTGYEPVSLVGKFIGEYVHPDDSGIFMREFNESIASGNALRFFYRFKKDDGSYMIVECDGHPHISNEPGEGQVLAGQCRGFFMMARPYPTKNAALLDSFLEHKIENERLMKRVEELKNDEAKESAEDDRAYREQLASQTGATPSESPQPVPGLSGPRAEGEDEHELPADQQIMPPPAKPSISNTALTRQNLDSALSAQKPDSIADKMSRYEASATHLESIELMTGLRYRDGERSHGISTGDTSPALIKGDAGIAILLDRDRDGGKKEKKKLKVADEYVCADCGTLDSPEWRRGPRGPKTLCNACGLRWAKKEKKRSGDDGKVNSPGAPAMQPVGGPMHTLPGAIPQPPGLPMQTSSGSS